MKIEWRPDKGLGVPLYEQIKDYIKDMISCGDWPIGSKMPTQRELADIFEVNRSTVVTALEELMAEGLIEGKGRDGTVVINNTWSLLSSAPPPDWSSYIKSGTHRPNVDTIQQINKMEFEPNIIRLGTGELSPELFPKKMMDSAIGKMTFSMDSLGYEEPKGSHELREAVSLYLKGLNINASPGQILIVSGSLQALQLICIGILYRGSTILVEKPSYLYSINVAQSAGMKLFGIPMDEQGIELSKIARYRRQSNAAILYTIPSFHNPSGVVMSQRRRTELLGICEKERLPIIEDDVYRELWIDEPAPPPLKSMDKNGLVLYAGSLSKSLCPGLRIGWIVGPEGVIERLGDIKMQTDYGSSSLSQLVAAQWLRSGLYEEYLSYIRTELRKRRDRAIAALDKYFHDIAKWDIPMGGFYIWLKLNKPIPMQRLFNECLDKGILINPGNIYHDTQNQYIRISYSYASLEDIEKGLYILSSLIKDMGF